MPKSPEVSSISTTIKATPDQPMDILVEWETVSHRRETKKLEATYRHHYVNNQIDQQSFYYSGTMELTFPNGEILKLRSKNMGKRLDQVFRDLLRGKSSDKRIDKLAKAYNFKSLEELSIIEVKVLQPDKQ